MEFIGVAVIVAMVVLGRRAPTPEHAGLGERSRPCPVALADATEDEEGLLVVWGALITGVVGWDLFSFLVQSSSFPTLSTLVGHITHHPLGRGLLFATWLLVGAYAVVGWRVATRR